MVHGIIPVISVFSITDWLIPGHKLLSVLTCTWIVMSRITPRSSTGEQGSTITSAMILRFYLCIFLWYMIDYLLPVLYSINYYANHISEYMDLQRSYKYYLIVVYNSRLVYNGNSDNCSTKCHHSTQICSRVVIRIRLWHIMIWDRNFYTLFP